MQATKNIIFESCGRRFKLHDYRGTNLPSTVSGRGQNWLDFDGSVSGLNEPTIIGSGLSDAGLWWKVDSDVIHDPQGPLEFIKQNNGPNRGLGHIRFEWDENIHRTVGSSSCSNGSGKPCTPLGRVRHLGPMFDSSKDPDGGLPITANPDIVGPVGGYGWLLRLNDGAPHTVKMPLIEVDSSTPLLLAIAYPRGTSFTVKANAASWCRPTSGKYTCTENFSLASSATEVREGSGNKYYFRGSTCHKQPAYMKMGTPQDQL